MLQAKTIDKRKLLIRATIGSFLFFIFIYISITYRLEIGNDIRDHANIAKAILVGQKNLFSGPFILYGLSIILSFFSKSLNHIMMAICIILAAATTLKLIIATKQVNKIKIFKDRNKNYWISFAIGLSLMFVFVIPVLYISNKYFYIGNFVPNVWHNSTTILLMPFAILLYIVSIKQIKSYDCTRDIQITILILLNIFIKPSFIFVFICIYPLIILLKYRFSKTFFRSLLPLIIGGMTILAQYLLIYKISDPHLEPSELSGIGIGFFDLYKIKINIGFLPITLISSYFFPIAYSILNRKKLINNIVYIYTILLTSLALLIYAVLFETGPRFLHGNFYWQIVPCSWLLYFITIIYLSKDIKQSGFTLKNKILTAIYTIHVLFGILYLARIIIKHYCF